MNEGQPLIQQDGLLVEWHPDQDIDEDEYDADFEPTDVPDIALPFFLTLSTTTN